MAKGKFKLKVVDEDVAYLYLPAHPGKVIPGYAKRTVRLLEHVPKYKGADLYLDFDEAGEVIGVEILI